MCFLFYAWKLEEWNQKKRLLLGNFSVNTFSLQQLYIYIVYLKRNVITLIITMMMQHLRHCMMMASQPKMAWDTQ